MHDMQDFRLGCGPRTSRACVMRSSLKPFPRQPPRPSFISRAVRAAAAPALSQQQQAAGAAFSFTVLQAPMMSKASAQQLPPHLQPYATCLESVGGAASPPCTTAAGACTAALAAACLGVPLVLLIGTGGTEALALEAARAYHEAYRQAHLSGAEADSSALPPLLLLAHPFANSLPAALETLARLQQDGLKGRIVYLPSAEADAQSGSQWDTLQQSLQAVRVWLQLHAASIGLVGPPSPWLVASAPAAPVVRSAWGPQLVDIGMEELMGPLEQGQFDPGEVQQAVEDLVGGTATSGAASSSCQCSQVDAAPAAQAYLALRDIVRSHELQCLSVRCFDIVTGASTTGCYALARLLDEGVIAGCEGDICSALGMLWGRLMTGQVPWMANVAQVDPARNSVTLAHCTVARSLLSSVETNTHFESGLGVAIQGPMPPGPATLVRIGGKRLEQLWVVEGEVAQMEEGQWSSQLCRTQVHMWLESRGNEVEQLLRRPLGNHVVLLRGRQKALLEGYWSEFGPGAAQVNV